MTKNRKKTETGQSRLSYDLLSYFPEEERTPRNERELWRLLEYLKGATNGIIAEGSDTKNLIDWSRPFLKGIDILKAGTGKLQRDQLPYNIYDVWNWDGNIKKADLVMINGSAGTEHHSCGKCIKVSKSQWQSLRMLKSLNIVNSSTWIIGVLRRDQVKENRPFYRDAEYTINELQDMILLPGMPVSESAVTQYHF